MGFGLGSSRHSILQKTRNACVMSLAVLVGLVPVSASASQGAAQTGAGGANSLAQGLSQATGVLSMGLGGLYMAKGAQQLSCCSTGCSGNGAASQKTKQNLDSNTKDQAKKLFLKLNLNQRFPDSVRFDCPQSFLPDHGLFSLLHFFQPPQASAAGGCLDAMIALATGGLMLLQGLMSLNAANQASKNADAAYANAGGMGSYPGGVGTSPTPESKNIEGTSIGGNSRTGELVKIDPSLLRTGKANEIMGQFEDKFGIGRDNFANAVLNGEDPRKILGSAPRNALSTDDMNKATSAAKGMSDADKANAIAGTGLSEAQKDLAAKMELYAVNLGGSGGSAGYRSTSSKRSEEDLEDLEGLAAKPADTMLLSPEVQTALKQKATEDRSNGIHDLTLFQVVRNKYREKSKMIFGYDPDGIPKGVNNANGL